jgi:hypothetical protein
MITSKSVRRVAVMTTVAVACAAPAATARVADAPVHQPAITTSVQTPGVPPRVDSVGKPPSDRSERLPVPVVQPSNGGFDWASAAIGAAALLSLTLFGVAGWAVRHGRRTTLPHGNGVAS